MKARMSAHDLIARLRSPRSPRVSARPMSQLSESERLRITRFTVEHRHERPDADSVWILEVYGFGSSMPLARQHVELPTNRAHQPDALDELLASLSLVRWGACMTDSEGTRIEGCCVQDFVEAPKRSLSARHAA